MTLKKPKAVDDENTFEKKLMNKGLAYLLRQDNAGERHEVATLYRAHRGMIDASNKTFQVLRYKDFSRSALSREHFTEDIGNKKVKWFKDRASKCFPALAKDAKLLFGDNEIDALGTAEDGTQALIECKSGSAKSSGTQTSSYMQACTELAVKSEKPVWFVHCHDTKTSLSSAYVWSCLDAINGNTRVHLKDESNDFLIEALKNKLISPAGNTDKKIDKLIDWHNKKYKTFFGSADEQSKIESMNRIMSRHFSVEIHDTYIALDVDRDLIKGWLAKLFKETSWYNMSKPKSIWMQVYLDGLQA